MTIPSVDLMFSMAEKYADAGDFARARTGYSRVLSLEPTHADSMLQLSYLDSFAGRHRSAHEWLLRSLSGALPARMRALVETVQRLRTFNELAELRAYCDRLLGSNVHYGVLLECARQLSILNDYSRADACLDAALRVAPQDIGARLLHGQFLANRGEVDSAAAEFEWVLAQNRANANAWWLLIRLRLQTAEQNHVSQLQAQLRAPGLTAGDVALLARALHKSLDDVGDYSGAWRALEVMCQARRSKIVYSARTTRDLVDALMSSHPDVVNAPSARDDRKTPIFIVGMHRSGTTLLEQLMDASDDVRGLGELNDFSSALRYETDHYSKHVLDIRTVALANGLDYASLGSGYMASVAPRLGHEAFFTDKQPANFLNVGYICRALPHAKILHLVRDPMETCFSNLRELFTEINPYSYVQSELADYFLQYRRLMAHWHHVYPGRILDVSYSELTEMPEKTMRAVSGFCGIGYEDGMQRTCTSSRPVSTASSVQIRGVVAKHRSAKWRPYAQVLAPLVTALHDAGLGATTE